MVRRHRYLHLDVFTDRVFGGNQLAVFPDAKGLSGEMMQAIAREMNFSESTFILPKDRPDTDIRMRIFTPLAEMPMAGHPTVGSTFALGWEKVIPTGQARWVWGLPIGPTPVDIEWRGVDPSFVWMTQRAPTFGKVIEDKTAVAAMLGIEPGDIRADLPVQTVSCGVPFIFVPLATRASVDCAAPDHLAITRVCRGAGLEDLAVFVFARESGTDQATVYCRMFAPNLGIYEDPATGAASGPLGCYLVRYGLVRQERAGSILSLQGAAMGRPSWIHIGVALVGDEITGAYVGGEAVVVGEGVLIA